MMAMLERCLSTVRQVGVRYKHSVAPTPPFLTEDQMQIEKNIKLEKNNRHQLIQPIHKVFIEKIQPGSPRR